MTHTQFPSNLGLRELRYGAALALAVALTVTFRTSQLAQAQKENVIHSFNGGPNDGVYPSAGVILDAAGNIYGTTWLGGTAELGTVFEISKHGETLLHSFGAAADESRHPSRVEMKRWCREFFTEPLQPGAAPPASGRCSGLAQPARKPCFTALPASPRMGGTPSPA